MVISFLINLTHALFLFLSIHIAYFLIFSLFAIIFFIPISLSNRKTSSSILKFCTALDVIWGTFHCMFYSYNCVRDK